MVLSKDRVEFGITPGEAWPVNLLLKGLPDQSNVGLVGLFTIGELREVGGRGGEVLWTTHTRQDLEPRLLCHLRA